MQFKLQWKNYQITIHNSKALVLGLGRCGATLAGLLNALGAHVYVAVRKEADLARGFVKVIRLLHI